MTINEAITQALNLAGKPISSKEIYKLILDKNLYDFKAEKPYHVMLVQLRRHSKGIEFSTSSKNKLFQLMQNGTYWLFNRPVLDKTIKVLSEIQPRPTDIFKKIKSDYTEYVSSFKKSILEQLKKIDPYSFEIFAQRLLQEYGFTDIEVTRKSKDGGIDGYGKLKVGISNLNISFQCKRWKNGIVGRTEIDKFRGAIQGEYEQGIFFTTSKFTIGAQKADIKSGAVPIILIDGELIVDFMIEKKFGIDVENLPIYINALDQVITND